MTHARQGLGEVLVSARSYAEYVAMFDLTGADLAGRVLDCPGGAAGFTATALDRGRDVTAVDPAYAGGPAALAALADHARAEAHRGHRYLLDHTEDYVWTSFADPQEHLEQRLAAVEVFAAGVADRPERYVAGALPDLPFTDASFDLALCSHLLFTYADRLDPAWHLAALLDLVRVAGQVRVFPLVGHVDGRRYARLDALRDDLAADGVASELRHVPYELQRGGDQVLVLAGAAS